MKTITLNISGMTCGGCSSSLKKLLEAAKGVSAANVSHETNSAEVTFDERQISTEQFEQIIDGAGFELEDS